jgi:hypothetical protein
MANGSSLNPSFWLTANTAPKQKQQKTEMPELD